MSNRGQQKSQHIHDIENLQCKAIEIMNFKSKYAPSKPLFIDLKKMTLQDIIKTQIIHTQNAAYRQITLPQVRTTN